MVAQINCQYLQPLGDFQIDGIFNSGAAAQEYLKENEADLAIVDIYMPRMNGANCCAGFGAITGTSRSLW